MSAKPRILVLIGAFWPGHESSGPNLSIRAQCEALADRFEFLVVARDRAFGAVTPLDDGRGWRDLGYARARYLPVGAMGAHGLAALLRETPHDLLVLNGFFDREFTLPALFARRLRRGRRAPVLVSPRGEFTSGARSLKSGRKRVFATLARVLGLHRGVHVHATSPAELADIEAALPGNRVTLVPNFRPLFAPPPHVPRDPGAPLRLAFLGRISPVKGLDIALEALARAEVPARLDIYGPVSDPVHWQRCAALIAALPPHIAAIHHGEIANAEAPAMLAAHDALLLPSLSENFGHAIFESLASGTPVIIGDRTPWRDLGAACAGFDCPVGGIAAFADAIRTLEAMDLPETAAWREGALARARAHALSSDAQSKMAQLFDMLIAREPQ